jgi:endonuclease/exonuclease/phosphatase family metal-dependent hydrolase
MTQNLYVGADVDRVIGALLTSDPNDDLTALLFAIETLRKTDYPARAEVIADEIARTRPHAVGLQEVSKIDIDLRPLAPVVVHLDFLPMLQQALAQRGLHYQVAAQVQNTNVNLFGGAVRLVDNDAMLVDVDRVVVTEGGGHNFTARVPPERLGGIALLRGWVFARAVIDDRRYTIVSLHAEANLAGNSLSDLRAAQMIQLVGTLSSPDPTILIGDFNDLPSSLMYQVLQAAGFTDAWGVMRPGTRGYTCCHLPDLSDKTADFAFRIDYVFARGLGSGPQDKLFGKIDRFGEVPSDRVAGPDYPIWPSDHAGLVATLR